MKEILSVPKLNKTEEIRRLMGMGHCNDRIFHAVGWVTPEVFETEELRQLASGTSKHIPYDKAAAQALHNLIKTVRNQYQTEQDRQQRRDEIIHDDGHDGVNLSGVKEYHTERIPTGFADIDQVFGSSKLYNEDKVVGEVWGIPRGKLCLLGGEEGVGKTRWYTALSIVLAESFNLKIGIYQGEMSESEYKELMVEICRANGFKPNRSLTNIWVFKSEHHEKHCYRIKELGLDLFVWDSFPMLAKSNTRDGINDIVLDIKSAIYGQCAALMIAHLNERGQIKGNNHIRYMVDSNFYMTKEPELGDDVFSLISGKNRQGKSGVKAYHRHKDGSVQVLPSSEYAMREAALRSMSSASSKRKK